jgi:hypothetical protein
MLLSSNLSVVFFCGLEQLEMAITRRRFASLTERLHLLRRHRFEAARNSHVLVQHVQLRITVAPLVSYPAWTPDRRYLTYLWGDGSAPRSLWMVGESATSRRPDRKPLARFVKFPREGDRLERPLSGVRLYEYSVAPLIDGEAV